MRKDVVRNRARLLAAAREVFAEHGFGVTLDDIARHAGVGVGTAYRHFPNKQAIAAEVLTEATEAIAADARAALRVDDPWAALVGFFLAVGARLAADRGLHESLSGQGDEAAQDRIWPGVVESVTVLFERAQRSGVIRADVSGPDIAMLFAMLGPCYEVSRQLAPDLWRRYLELLLDGLRATDRPPLTVPPPPSTAVRQLIDAGKLRRR